MYNIGKLFSEKKIQLIVNYKMALFKLHRAFFVVVVVAEFINFIILKLLLMILPLINNFLFCYNQQFITLLKSSK